MSSKQMSLSLGVAHTQQIHINNTHTHNKTRIENVFTTNIINRLDCVCARVCVCWSGGDDVYGQKLTTENTTRPACQPIRSLPPPQSPTQPRALVSYSRELCPCVCVCFARGCPAANSKRSTQRAPLLAATIVAGSRRVWQQHHRRAPSRLLIVVGVMSLLLCCLQQHKLCAAAKAANSCTTTTSSCTQHDAASRRRRQRHCCCCWRRRVAAFTARTETAAHPPLAEFSNSHASARPAAAVSLDAASRRRRRCAAPRLFMLSQVCVCAFAKSEKETSKHI